MREPRPAGTQVRRRFATRGEGPVELASEGGRDRQAEQRRVADRAECEMEPDQPVRQVVSADPPSREARQGDEGQKDPFEDPSRGLAERDRLIFVDQTRHAARHEEADHVPVQVQSVRRAERRESRGDQDEKQLAEPGLALAVPGSADHLGRDRSRQDHRTGEEATVAVGPDDRQRRDRPEDPAAAVMMDSAGVERPGDACERHQDAGERGNGRTRFPPPGPPLWPPTGARRRRARATR